MYCSTTSDHCIVIHTTIIIYYYSGKCLRGSVFMDRWSLSHCGFNFYGHVHSHILFIVQDKKFNTERIALHLRAFVHDLLVEGCQSLLQWRQVEWDWYEVGDTFTQSIGPCNHLKTTLGFSYRSLWLPLNDWNTTVLIMSSLLNYFDCNTLRWQLFAGTLFCGQFCNLYICWLKWYSVNKF